MEAFLWKHQFWTKELIWKSIHGFYSLKKRVWFQKSHGFYYYLRRHGVEKLSPFLSKTLSIQKRYRFGKKKGKILIWKLFEKFLRFWIEKLLKTIFWKWVAIATIFFFFRKTPLEVCLFQVFYHMAIVRAKCEVMDWFSLGLTIYF